LTTSCAVQFVFSEQPGGYAKRRCRKVKSIQTRLSDLTKENRPLVLADTFPRERESGEDLPVLDLSNEQGSTYKSPDPLIQGLINRLPEPDSSWALTDRVKWLRTASNIFGLIYKSEGEDTEVKLVLAKDP
jgi:hypothetical protein